MSGWIWIKGSGCAACPYGYAANPVAGTIYQTGYNCLAKDEAGTVHYPSITNTSLGGGSMSVATPNWTMGGICHITMSPWQTVSYFEIDMPFAYWGY